MARGNAHVEYIEYPSATYEPAEGANPPFSDLSIELGHFYPDDLDEGVDGLAAVLRKVNHFVEPAIASYCDRTGIVEPRVSTCLLVDDYRKLRDKTPQNVIGGLLLPAADKAGVKLDYIGREAACAEYTDVATGQQVRIAKIARSMIIDMPMPGTNGTRPPSSESGWLSNGQRSPAIVENDARGSISNWQPPKEMTANLHSVFMDVELFDKKGIWSCAMLATAWQLLRLGALYAHGQPAIQPHRTDNDPHWSQLDSDWDNFPPLIQITADAAPFPAREIMSILPMRYLPTEAAVQMILSQIGLSERARCDDISPDLTLTDRANYTFIQ